MSISLPTLCAQPLADYAQAVALLQALISTDHRPYAQRARQALFNTYTLLDHLGQPQRRLRVVHIAGSKGKGSTALALEALLRAQGQRVGTFTSPHLVDWTERIRIDGQPISQTLFTHALEAVRPLLMQLPTPAGFFDVLTVAALWLFAEQALDTVIMEVGIGGLLDATNVVEPCLTMITSLEYEHCDKLGTSLAAIAQHKAGICKPGVPLLSGRLASEAQLIVRAHTQALGCEWWQVGAALQLDTYSHGLAGTDVQLRFGDWQLQARLPVLGEHLAANVGLACVAARYCCATWDEARLSAALQTLQLPGRCELVRHRPWVMLDGAHTPQSWQQLGRALERLSYSRLHVVLSLSGGRDMAALLAALPAATASVTLTQADAQRSLSAEVLALAVAQLRPEWVCRVEPRVEQALQQAYAQLSADDLLLVTGSVYVAGAGRALWT